MKKEVDSFKEGKRIPACQLLAIAQKSQHHEVTNLIHQLKLLGTKTRSYIMLFRSPVDIPGNSISHDFVWKCLGKGKINIFPIWVNGEPNKGLSQVV